MSTGGSIETSISASSSDCRTPWPARAGSDGIFVGPRTAPVYFPVAWSTDQLDRN
jgi:hypothetical protein